MEMLGGYKTHVEDFETAPEPCCQKCGAGAHCLRVERQPGIMISTCAICGRQEVRRNARELPPATLDNFCVDCGTPINKASKRCGVHGAIHRCAQMANKCIDCGKGISKNAERCKACANRVRYRNGGG